MGFCTDENRSSSSCDLTPGVEQAMVDSGIILLKYWLEVSPDEQTRRLQSRIDDPRKIWKLSDLDLLSYTRWYDYSRARDDMFAATDTRGRPGSSVTSDDKKRARLNVITHLLDQVPYEPLPKRKVVLPDRKDGRTPSPRGFPCTGSRPRSDPSDPPSSQSSGAGQPPTPRSASVDSRASRREWDRPPASCPPRRAVGMASDNVGANGDQERRMSVVQAAFIGVGSMVGAGIFALLGAAGEVAGAAVWLSFLIAGGDRRAAGVLVRASSAPSTPPAAACWSTSGGASADGHVTGVTVVAAARRQRDHHRDGRRRRSAATPAPSSPTDADWAKVFAVPRSCS